MDALRAWKSANDETFCDLVKAHRFTLETCFAQATGTELFPPRLPLAMKHLLMRTRLRAGAYETNRGVRGQSFFPTYTRRITDLL
jgi:hypothetical protein